MYSEYREGFGQRLHSLTGSFTDLLMANASQDLGLVFSGCFAFATWGTATPDGGMIVGRNLDESSLSDIGRLQSLNFYVPENGLRFVTLNYPAFSGVMHGMNENGVVITMNFSKVIRSERTIDGLPFMFMLRKALQYGRTIDEVISMIRQTPRTIGLNILVADASAKRAAVVEVSAHRMKVREADGVIFAANRFKTEYMSGYQSDGWLGSALREARFERLHQEWRGQFDLHHAVAVLRDKNNPALAGGAGLMPGIHNEGSIASIVFDPGRLEVWAASSGGNMAPDLAFLGFSAGEVWQTAEPVQPIGIIPPVEETQYVKDWRDVMAASVNNDEKEIQARLAPVVGRNPEEAFPLLLLGTSYLREGKAEGYELLERLVGLPGVAEPFYLMQGHFWLGVFYDTDRQREHAVEHYRAALAVEVPDLQRDYGSIRRLCEAGLQRPLVYRRKGAGK